MEKNDVQKKLFSEINNKKLFQRSLGNSLDYVEEVFERTVFPSKQAISNLDSFNEALPDNGLPGESIIETLNKYGSPATVAQLGGRYFGFVNGSAVPAGIAAKLMATFWDQNTALNIISPISGKLEAVVEQWLNELFGFDNKCVSGFVTGTSAANFCGISAARYRILSNLGWDVNEKGLRNAPAIRIVAGKHAHSSVIKAVNMNGLGQECIEWVDTDLQGRIEHEKMPPLDNSCIVLLQAGNVNSGAFDNFNAVCKKANESGAWVHIDGAFGLWAQCSSTLKKWTNGIHLADSWAVDGHKTLNTPYDCGIIICKHQNALRSAMHMSGSYIMKNETRDGMYHTGDMSRRSRIIELWATIKSLGKKGIDELVTNMHLRALQFASLLTKANGFEVLNEIDFNQIIVCCKTNDLTEKVMRFIQDDGTCWVGHSKWNNKRVIRISICSWATTKNDVALSFHAFKRALQKATT
ncbi:MAG: aminotransferase class V-fold PLP-dependent enzyme [Bacteroidia bacterium]|nr:aminotransferase class V-fold PLP-dependent enzyme [Bacteroidia bacterium]